MRLDVRFLVSFKAIIRHRHFVPAMGALLAVACGVALLRMPVGERWENGSYDSLVRFGARPVTNQVVLILMDNEAHQHFGQVRGQPWDRNIHAQLLNRLADERARLVVIDIFFEVRGEEQTDAALAEAMRRNQRVVLMAKQAEATRPGIVSARSTPPIEPFLSAAGGNCGVAWFDPDLRDFIVRRHWPFPTHGPYDSLSWTAARIAGANLPTEPLELWLRYYGEKGPWTALSYHFALMQPSNFFRDKIVFIGNKPETSLPDGEKDEFRTPFTGWSGETVGGVEIHATAFLNLINQEWLRRTGPAIEVVVIAICGILLGLGLCRVRPITATLISVGAALGGTVLGASLSYWTNWWFPWLIVVGGQVPCALLFAVATSFRAHARERGADDVLAQLFPRETAAAASLTPEIDADVPDARDYEIETIPFGKGAYGKVRLAKNAIGQWQALKTVYRAKFGDNPAPYDAEFEGIKRYKPISDKHPGLLRVDFVSRRKAQGYYYYVMELGDSVVDGWQVAPATYRPLDLRTLCGQHPQHRLPVNDCIQIVAELADALHFLHQQGLTHRDIKPPNIIFVNGHPKLADVGLMTDIRPPEEVRTRVGTLGYMPPSPENAGTIQADIYALGMVLYVISTGTDPALFPELSTTLVQNNTSAEFMHLNRVILRACDPDLQQRYASASALQADLLALLQRQSSLH